MNKRSNFGTSQPGTSAPSLFGAAPAPAFGTTPAPAFGAAPASAPAFGATPALFGAAQPVGTAPSLFGTPASSLFGTAQTTQAPSLFGANPAPAQTPFGATTQAPSLFGAATQAPSLFGPASTTLQGQAIGQGQVIGQGPISMKTRFADLPDSVQKQMEQVQRFISTQISTCESLQSGMETPILSIHQATVALSHKLIGLRNLLERDILDLESLKQKVTQELRHSDLGSRYLDRLSSSTFYSLPANESYSTYFSQFVDSLESQMTHASRLLDSISTQLKSRSQKPEATPQKAQEIIKFQHDSFLSLARQVSSLHDTVLKEFERFNSGKSVKTGYAMNTQDIPLSLIASSTLKPMEFSGPSSNLLTGPVGGGFAPSGFSFGLKK